MDREEGGNDEKEGTLSKMDAGDSNNHGNSTNSDNDADDVVTSPSLFGHEYGSE